MGSPSLLIRHSSWKIISAWLRVLTKSSAMSVGADRVVDVGERIAGGVAGPRHALLGLQDGDVRLGAAGDGDERRRLAQVAAALPDQPGAERVRIGDGRRQADGPQPRRQAAQAREAEREQVAALAGHQRVEFVEDDRVEIGEEAVGVRGGESAAPPAPAWSAGCRAARASGAGACAAGCRRCGSPAARAARSRRPAFEVAGDVDGERLERRDVERVDAAPAAAPCSAGVRAARPGSAGSRPASCRRRSAR